MTSKLPSATPEGKPSAREVAHAFYRELLGKGYRVPDCADHPGECDTECNVLVRFVCDDRARRDALHAETERRLHESYGKLLGSANHDVERLAAALQHGEERERVMREALERAGHVRGGMCVGCGANLQDCNCIYSDERTGSGPARRALATAQAMKEGSGT